MEIFLESGLDEEARRDRVYEGDIFFFGASPAGSALCDLARGMLEDAFHPLDPRSAQHEMAVEDFADILAALKPAFIHHPEAKRIIVELLLERGCDLESTFFDVPRLRSSTSDGYLTSGIAYAFHPHRDTWYSAPACQLNWWLPVYPAPPESGMIVYPRYFASPVQNSSSDYDYARWNKESRFSARQHLHRDTRQQPAAQEELDLRGGVILNGEPGSLAVFSAAQLHASVENCSGATRFSIDFRTANIDDVVNARGAQNVDSACSGTTLGDYLRGSDLSPVPEHWVKRYSKGVGA